MFNQAATAKLFHRPITINGDGAVLNVELLQFPAAVGDALNSSVTHHLAALDTEFLQIGAIFCEDGQAGIGHITLSHIQGPQSGAGPRQGGDRPVTDRLAAPHIQVPQLVTEPGDLGHAGVGYLIAFCHREVAEVGPQFGQLVEAQVGDLNAVGDAEFSEREAARRDALDADICNGEKRKGSFTHCPSVRPSVALVGKRFRVRFVFG